MQAIENFWLFILFYCIKNVCLQFLPSWRLVHHLRVEYLVLEDVVDHLKILFALVVAQDSSSGEEYGSIVLESDRNGVERLGANLLYHEIAHVSKQFFENFWLVILLDRSMNLCLQFLPSGRWRCAVENLDHVCLFADADQGDGLVQDGGESGVGFNGIGGVLGSSSFILGLLCGFEVLEIESELQRDEFFTFGFFLLHDHGEPVAAASHVGTRKLLVFSDHATFRVRFLGPFDDGHFVLADSLVSIYVDTD